MEELQEFSARGGRKEATARVWLRPGSGAFEVNGRDAAGYFKRETLLTQVLQPLQLTGTLGKFDILARVKGGGLSGQAGAVRLAIARALVLYDPSLRKPLKKAGMLTRDPREKERKKYGLVKARKAFQFSKR
ncbi:MAG: 30S ribosomal protein S9 [Candidatus Latescibacterota bacterium]|nr:MAG: 30S ribosomal protein S9 [Candidatus Latescibacterota bacterium]RKY63374.1 MAG: 30S ribosomal protein S9 [Candidatus Latescibacterota bacterium]RKY74659.1 MAG: 30S ribosomal protein S9 [Candidatus Latescibacterota bacterium]HDH99357.1 30S ribosomal protein S9 [Bacillota bacterium]